MSITTCDYSMEIEVDDFFSPTKFLSKEERIWIIAQRLDCFEIKQIIELWPFQRQCPSPSSIYRLINKVKETGSIKDKKRSGRTKTEDTIENREIITSYVEKYRHISVRDISTELEFNKSFVDKVLIESGYHAYKISDAPLLKSPQKKKRKDFGCWYLQLKQQTKEVIWWSDECWFRLEAAINSQNTRVWAKKNPHEIRECPFRTKPIKFWAAINGKGETVFYEVEENMNAETYVAMLKEVFPSMGLRWRLFQQDGASCHTAKITTQFLDRKCKRGWIGIGSDLVEWPANSPDIAPCDYGLWPYLQSRIMKRMATTRQQLREYVIEEFSLIQKQVIINICNDMQRRCELLVLAEGGNVEHI